MIMSASALARGRWQFGRGLFPGRGLIRIHQRRAEEIAGIMSGTRQFQTSDVTRSARVETASRASHHLLALSAYSDTADICLSVADEPGLLPEPRAPETPASEYVRIAHAQRLDGREQLALHILETAIVMTSVDASVAFEIAQTHGAAGHVDRALTMYDTAIRLDPECLDAHWQRGVLLERRGQVDEALEAWRRSDLTRHAGHHSLYLAAAMKSPRSTNESLLAAHREWTRHHTARPR
jgi:tetratricopeptide (TPR) repeat protein